MKKFGFTLAEVMITLGIIGVVAALTLPALYTDAQSAQIGPKLGKAASVFEQANQAMLNDNNADAVSDVYNTAVKDNDSTFDYMTELSNYMTISPYNGGRYFLSKDGNGFSGVVFDSANNLCWQSKDGALYFVNFWNSPRGANTTPHNQRIGAVVIDLNGESGPNEWGSDIFPFYLYDDGTLDPNGSVRSGGSWRETCPNDAFPTLYSTCTASIFENNMRVMYRMR